MWWKAIILWFVLMVLAIVNGTVRVKWIIPSVGLTSGLAISTLMLCTLIIAATWLGIAWMGPRTNGEAMRIGMLWLCMTLGFEFGIGHFVFKKPWPELLADYNIAKGRIWVLVLITTATAPWITAKLRGLLS
ncbi:MAG TPA: hypothetical protein PK760_00025 [Flavobacteriales bacterium]|nr:hypothetical protein [Flavobacteriales bacterium]